MEDLHPACTVSPYDNLLYFNFYTYTGIAGPTVYRYGYLWAVHSLYYWWRDQGLAEEGSLQAELSPCYLNRMDTSEVAVGWGKYTFEFLRTAINRYSPFTTGYPLELVNCFAPPPKEYVFPKDLYPFD